MTSDTSQSHYGKHLWKGLACLHWRLRTSCSHSSSTTHSGWGCHAVDPSSSGDYGGSRKERFCWQLSGIPHLISDTDSKVVKRELIWKTALTLVWAPSGFQFLLATMATLIMDIRPAQIWKVCAVRVNRSFTCLISAVRDSLSPYDLFTHKTTNLENKINVFLISILDEADEKLPK